MVSGVVDSGSMTVLQAWERHRVNSVTDLGLAPTWSMALLARVGEDGVTYGGLDRSRERRCGGSREDSTMAWASGRSMTTRTPGKFLVGNFGILTT
jgi:hypothetical protein